MEPRDRHRYPSLVTGYDIVMTDDGSYTLIELQTQASFHSLAGAVAETFHVYVKPWWERVQQSPPRDWRILEMGFGTGLGWLMSAMRMQSSGQPSGQSSENIGTLSFVSLEKHLLPISLLQQLQPLSGIRSSQVGSFIPNDFPIVESVVDHTWQALSYRDPSQREVEFSSGASRLRIEIGDALEVWQRIPEDGFDVVYWDPFAPDTSPELWSGAFIRSVVERLRPDGCLVTYSVSGAVRRCFEELGCRVKRVAGPPRGKREVLVVDKERL